MPDLSFQVEQAEPLRYAVAPTLVFQLRVWDTLSPADHPTPIHAVALRCQIRIEPARRRYTPREQEGLGELFGEPQRWGQTLKPMLWTHTSVIIPPFEGRTTVDLPVPCTFDFNVAGTKYFHALEDGEVPLCLLFSGSVFYRAEDCALQVAPISWEKEANFRLPVRVWKEMMELYYPNTAWLCLRRDVVDALQGYKTHRGLATWEQTLESLLTVNKEPAAP
jgi:hypothetical protein